MKTLVKKTLLCLFLLILNLNQHIPNSYSTCTETSITIDYPSSYQEFHSNQQIQLQGKLTSGPPNPPLEIVIVNTQNWDTYLYRFNADIEGNFDFTLFQNIDEPSPGQWKASISFREDLEYCVSTDNVLIVVTNDSQAEPPSNLDSNIDAISYYSEPIYVGTEVRNEVSLTDPSDGSPIVGETVWLTITRPNLSWYETSDTTDSEGQVEFIVELDMLGFTTLTSYWSGNSDYNAYEYSWDLEAYDKKGIPSFPIISILTGIIAFVIVWKKR